MEFLIGGALVQINENLQSPRRSVVGMEHSLPEGGGSRSLPEAQTESAGLKGALLSDGTCQLISGSSLADTLQLICKGAGLTWHFQPYQRGIYSEETTETSVYMYSLDIY